MNKQTTTEVISIKLAADNQTQVAQRALKFSVRKPKFFRYMKNEDDITMRFKKMVLGDRNNE